MLLELLLEAHSRNSMFAGKGRNEERKRNEEERKYKR